MNASKEAMWGTEMGMMPSAPLPPSISGQGMGRVEIIRGEERGLAWPVVRLAGHQGEDAEEAGGDGGGEEA